MWRLRGEASFCRGAIPALAPCAHTQTLVTLHIDADPEWGLDDDVKAACAAGLQQDLVFPLMHTLHAQVSLDCTSMLTAACQ